MRPRFANRGSEEDEDADDTPRPASMRPRFANRGSAKVGRSLGADGIGFNEAPIRESGKCSQLPPVCPDRHRFNEAPIRESGKYGGRRISGVVGEMLQ